MHVANGARISKINTAFNSSHKEATDELCQRLDSPPGDTADSSGG